MSHDVGYSCILIYYCHVAGCDFPRATASKGWNLDRVGWGVGLWKSYAIFYVIVRTLSGVDLDGSFRCVGYM